MLSQTAEYALRTVLYLADRGDGPSASADELARVLGVPRNYLSKTLHRLAREGILASARGRGGGFRLAADPGGSPCFGWSSHSTRSRRNGAACSGGPPAAIDTPALRTTAGRR